MLSDSIKYQDLWSEIHTKNKIGSKRIKILILNSGRLQISRHISFVGSNRLYKWRISLVTTRQSKEIAAWNVKKQQGYCSVGYARVVERSEKFDSIKYKNQRSAKLIFDPQLIPINKNRKQAD